MRNRLFTLALLLLSDPAVVFAQGIRELPANYPYPPSAWSPYLAGGLIGLLAIMTMTLSKKIVGASSAYADLAGLIGRLISARHIKKSGYYQQHPPTLSWTLLFVLGAVGGSFLSAWSGGELTGYYLQDLWVARFGNDSFWLRTVVGFCGGTAMGFGARLAGGCTSGHGISGTLQLAVASWISVLCFFAGGIVTAMLLYRL